MFRKPQRCLGRDRYIDDDLASRKAANRDEWWRLMRVVKARKRL
jgi:hypothetical protein